METKEKNETKVFYHEKTEHKAHGIVFGLLVILAGAALLFFNMEPYASDEFFMNLKSFIFSLPMVPVILSIFSFTKKEWTGGIFLLLLGLVFLAPSSGFLFAGNPELAAMISSRTIIYLALIILGLMIVIKAISGKSHCQKPMPAGSQSQPIGKADMKTDDNKRINYKFTFSGAEQVYLEPVFYGGNIRCTFGGMELDLMHTTLPEGETHLNVRGVFGGINIKVPSDWYVEIRSNCVVGGFTDSRRILGTPDYSRKLIINARCTFGGGEIE